MDDAWLATVRIARDCGDISSLFPEGVHRIWDLPFTLFNSIRLALTFLSWEQLPEEEQPPKKIWLDTDKLDSWFREVKQNRESKARGEGDFLNMPSNAFVKEMFGRSHG